MSNLGQTLLIPAKGRSGYAVTPTNNIVTAVGDSITSVAAGATGGTVPIAILAAGAYGRYAAQLGSAAGVGSYFTWAAILPKTGDTESLGRVYWGGVHATVNFTTLQILNTHVQGTDSPANDLIKAHTVVVSAGANDAATISPGGVLSPSVLATWATNYSTIITTLIANGQLPVLQFITPTNTVDNQPAVDAMNAAIPGIAAQYNVPYVDVWTPCQTSKNWTAGYDLDGVHPSVTGAKVMGQALRDKLDTILPASYPTLATTATDDTTGWLYKNGSFTDDGNADGVPDGGGPTQSATFWSQVANGTAWTLGARAGYNGQAMRWNKTSDPGTSSLTSSGPAPPAPLEPDLHNIAFGFRMEVASWSANTLFVVEHYKVLDSTVKPFKLSLQTDSGFTDAILPFVWYQEFIQLSGYDDADSGKSRILISAAGTGTNTIDAYIGQMTLRDRTVTG